MNASFELEYVNCPLCSRHESVLFMEHVKELYNNLNHYFDLRKCDHCGFIFTNPRPTELTCAHFYPDTAGYYTPVLSEISTTFLENSFWGNLKRCLLVRDFAYAALAANFNFIQHCLCFLTRKSLHIQHIPNFIPSGKLLDIGCSWGRYLKMMSNMGWDVYGVETNEKAVQFARESLKLENVYRGGLAEQRFSDNHFDVVHASMVLEHLYDPKGAILEIRRILKPGGQFIFSVPNIEGFEMLVHKHYAYTIQVPQHVSHFSAPILRELLAKSGFEDIRIDFQYVDRDFVAPFALYRPPWHKVLTLPLVRKSVVKLLIMVAGKLGKTSRMSIRARKKYVE